MENAVDKLLNLNPLIIPPPMGYNNDWGYNNPFERERMRRRTEQELEMERMLEKRINEVRSLQIQAETARQKRDRGRRLLML